MDNDCIFTVCGLLIVVVGLYALIGKSLARLHEDIGASRRCETESGFVYEVKGGRMYGSGPVPHTFSGYYNDQYYEDGKPAREYDPRRGGWIAG